MGWLPENREHIETLWTENYYPVTWLADHFTLEEAMASTDLYVIRDLEKLRRSFDTTFLCTDEVARLTSD